MDGVSLLALPTELLMPATPRAAGGRSPPAAGKPGGTVKRAVRHQREPVGRRDDMRSQADPPTLPVRSDRVCAVLALLAERGHGRSADVSEALGVGRQSINALFQYLKRKALVGQDGRGAPYVLTPRGQEVLAEMRRRRAA
jgi:hypothetical protein